MFKNVPSFIVEYYKKNQYSGKIQSSVLLINLSGFTGMVEKLKTMGSEGYSEMNKFIAGIYSPITETVMRHGGFVSKFFSDQFFAIFPDENSLSSAEKALLCSYEILKSMKELARLKSPLGEFYIFCRIGIGTGAVEWGIFGKKEMNYYFKGEAFRRAYDTNLHGTLNRVTLDEWTVNQITDEKLKASVSRQKDLYFAENINIDMTSRENTMPVFYSEHSANFYSAENFINEIQNFTRPSILLVSFDDRAFDSEEELRDFLSFASQSAGQSQSVFGGLVQFSVNPYLTYYFDETDEECFSKAMKICTHFSEDFRISTKAVMTKGPSFCGAPETDYYSEFICFSRAINTAEMLISQMDERGFLITDEVNDFAKKNVKTELHSSYIEKGSVKETKIFRVVPNKTSEPAKGLFKERIPFGEKCLRFVNPFYEKKFAGVVLIRGEQGIGKSYFAAELAKRLKSTCYYLHCGQELNESLKPIKDFFDHFFFKDVIYHEKKDVFIQKYENFLRKCQASTSEGNVVLTEELIRTPTIIASLLGLSWENSVYNSIDQKNRFENLVFAVKNFILSTAFLSPLVLIFEDIENIDKDSIKIIQTLTRDIQNRQILIIATALKNDKSIELSLDEDVPVLEIELSKTSIQAQEEIIFSLLGEDLSDQDINRVTAVSAGNPFITEQYCLYINETLGNSQKTSAPSDLRDIVSLRSQAWRDDFRETIFLCAALGYQFEKNVLIKANPMNITQTELEKFYDAILEEGVEKRIFTYFSSNHIYFKNEEFRRQLIGIIEPDKKKSLFLSAAKTLESLFENDKTRYTQIAYLYQQAGDDQKACQYLTYSAEWSFYNFRLEESSDLIMKAFDLQNDLELKFDLALKMFSVQKEGDNFHMEDDLFELCKERFTSNSDHSSLIKLLYYRSYSYFRGGKKENALESIREAVRTAVQNGKKDMLPELYKFFANISFEYRDFDGALAVAEKAEELPEEIIEPHLGNIYSIKGTVFLNKGDFDKSLEFYEKAVKFFEETKNPSDLAPVLDNIAKIYFKKGKAGKGLEYSIKAFNVGKEIGSYRTMVVNLHNIGGVFMKARDFNKAVKFLEQSQRLSREIQNYKLESYILDKLGDIERARGYIAEAMSFYERSLENRIKSKDLYAAGRSYKFIADVLKGQHNYDKAKNYYVQSMLCFKKANDIKSLAGSIESYGINEFNKDKQNKFKALKCLEHAWNIYEKLNDYDRLTNLEKLINQVTWEGIDI
ncbi:AAA family ATPase [candidate division WOR-3 bacterium]|nr:AAA family ATPase [candidate division WOR-3 bacterium]